MTLPKIQSPTFRLKLASDGTEVKYRGFLVKEEKMLLVAKESDEKKDLIDAFKQIVSNCVVGDINVDSLPLFDLEYLFLMIRSKSQQNIAKVKFRDEEDAKEYDAIFNFDKVEVRRDPEHDKTIDLDGRVGVVMRYPTIRDLEALNLFDEATALKGESVIELIKKCIDAVYDEDSVHPMSEATDAEKDEFFDSLSGHYIEKLQKFFSTFPVVVGYVEYKKGNKIISREIRGAANFLA
jgi:hypothetical protein